MKNPLHSILICVLLCLTLLPSCAMTEAQKKKLIAEITTATTATVVSGVRQGLASYDQGKSLKQIEKDVLSATGKTAAEQTKAVINNNLPTPPVVDTTSGK